MKNAIHTLRIQNFKSIKDVEMKPRRVNIIIGAPNVGKSNILEAMSLLGGEWNGPPEKFMGYVLRYENLRQLFCDNLPHTPISVETDRDMMLLGGDYKAELYYDYLLLPKKTYDELINSKEVAHYSGDIRASETARALQIFPSWYTERVKNNGDPPNYLQTQLTGSGHSSDARKLAFHGAGGYAINRPIKYYAFSKGVSHSNGLTAKVLRPPHGDNLMAVIQTHSELRKEIGRLYAHYGLKFMLRMDERRLEVIKDLDGVIYSYPYSSTADTLQRLIFYLAAIESNDDAVILLEEPEAHSFPVYVSQLGRRIVKSRNNQFFVATHSPYLITEILEEMLTNDELKPELAMFVAYYEDYQTKVRQLTDDELIAVRVDGLDVFYNMARFVPGPDTDF